jgi:hypothetical protein
MVDDCRFVWRLAVCFGLYSRVGRGLPGTKKVARRSSAEPSSSAVEKKSRLCNDRNRCEVRLETPVVQAFDWETDKARATQKAAETHAVLDDLILSWFCVKMTMTNSI